MGPMASRVSDIVREASELDSADRAKVITQLIRTLDPPGEHVEDFEAAWSDEVARRKAEIERGEVELVDWETLRAELRSK